MYLETFGVYLKKKQKQILMQSERNGTCSAAFVSLQKIDEFSSVSRLSSLRKQWKGREGSRPFRNSYSSLQQNIFPMLIFL